MELEEFLKNWKHEWWNNRQCIYKDEEFNCNYRT